MAQQLMAKQNSEFLKSAFPNISEKEQQQLLKQLENSAAKPKNLSASKNENKIIVSSVVSISFKNSKLEINNLPFLLNEKVGIRYNLKLLEKHLQARLGSTAQILQSSHEMLFVLATIYRINDFMRGSKS